MRDSAFFSAVRRRTAAVTVRQFGRRAHRLTSLRNRPAHGARTRPPIVAGWFAILKHHVGGELPCVYTPKTTTFFFLFLFFSCLPPHPFLFLGRNSPTRPAMHHMLWECSGLARREEIHVPADFRKYREDTQVYVDALPSFTAFLIPD